MGAYFRLQLDEGTFREDTTPAFSQDTLALCRMFGMTPVKLHYAGADRRLQFEAFVANDPGDRRIFLTNHARSPERALIGHELVHRMRRERPALYDELVEALADAGVDRDRWAAFYRALREQTQRKEGRALSDAEIREEGVADLVGDLILDPAVWSALRRPTLLQRVSDWFGTVWRSLRRSQAPVDPLGGAGLVRDRARAMGAVRRVFGEWAASLAQPSPADAPVLASAAALRRDPDAPGGTFRSALLDALVAGKGAPANAAWQQWLGWLDGAQRRGEIKQGERTWLGLDAWLGQQKGSIPRQALVDYVRTHQVQVQDVVLGDELSGQLPSGWTLEQNADGNWIVRNEHNSPVTTPQRLREHALEVLPRTENPTKFSKYQLPGGESYRELLLTLPSNDEGNAEAWWNDEGGANEQAPFDQLSTAGRRDAIARYADEVGQYEDAGGTFRSSHFNEPNILAHVRFNERADVEGKRVLFLEEIQSDWHQAGRKRGYGGTTLNYVIEVGGRVDAIRDTRAEAEAYISRRPAVSQANFTIREETVPDTVGSVPDAPFKATDEWAMLAFRRMVVWAAEHGFDRIAWTTGAQQAERYDLSQSIDRVEYFRRPDGSYMVEAFPKNSNNPIWGKGRTDPEEIGRYLGKEIAEKIEARADLELKVLRDLDLKVGGEGLRAFYDQILPAAVNKWAKKLGGRVRETALEYSKPGAVPPMLRGPAWTPEDDVVRASVHSLDLTDAMRDAALAGLPLFKRAWAVLTPERAAIMPTDEQDPSEVLDSFAP